MIQYENIFLKTINNVIYTLFVNFNKIGISMCFYLLLNGENCTKSTLGNFKAKDMISRLACVKNMFLKLTQWFLACE